MVLILNILQRLLICSNNVKHTCATEDGQRFIESMYHKIKKIFLFIHLSSRHMEVPIVIVKKKLV